jgi:two-component system phosphate regulon response regulator OmpR
MKSTILVIDDDEKLNKLLSVYFERFGYDILTATHPKEGMNILDQKKPDIVVLDIMLPDMDGFEVLREIRRFNTIPIIMLTARGEVTDRIVGLELGADDYLPKPFEPRELLARIQSILRRTEGGPREHSLELGDLKIDSNRQVAFIDGEDIHLTSTEFAVLQLLVKNQGKVLNRDQILDELHGIEWEAFNRSVDILISRLRHKLKDDPKNPKYIKTVWGSGYIFIGGKKGSVR